MTFTPSDQFNERWLATPQAMKQAIYDELDDIIALLQNDSKLEGFHFRNLDLNDKLHHLHIAHLETLKTLHQKQRQERVDALLPILEAKIEQKLHDKVNERLVGLDKELKLWIAQVVADEVAKEFQS